jgi:N-acetylmuramoyl-L-alanine amidase
MNLHKLYLTNNACYKAGRTITPKGIMVHSTGANNPNIRRYIGPDDGLLGPNNNGNDWNRDTPEGEQVCVHAFIGKLQDGTIATYQTLPWNMRGWHCGGAANNTHISFEICEDGLTDPAYFSAVYAEAVELCVYLCKQYGLTEQNIICHSEGAALGLASNHADVMHWFPKHGKNMDNFREDVRDKLKEKEMPVMDNTPAAWAKEPVEWAKSKGLLKGDDDGNLRLGSAITRQELCVLLKRYDDMKGGNS